MTRRNLVPIAASVVILASSWAAPASSQARFASEFVGEPTAGGEPLVSISGSRTTISYPEAEDARFFTRTSEGPWIDIEGAGYGGDADAVTLSDGRIAMIEMIADGPNGTDWSLPMTIASADGDVERSFNVSNEPWWDRPWLLNHPSLGLLVFATGPTGTVLWEVDPDSGTTGGPHPTPNESDFAGRPILTGDGRIAFSARGEVYLSDDGRDWTTEHVEINTAPGVLPVWGGGMFPVLASDGDGRLHWVAASAGVHWSSRHDDGTWSPAIRISADAAPAALPWVVGNVGPGVVAVFLEGRDEQLPVNPPSAYLGTPSTVWDVIAVRVSPEGIERVPVFARVHRGTICAEGSPNLLGGGCQPAYALVGSPYHVQDRRLADFISVDRDQAGNVSAAFTYVGPDAVLATGRNRIVLARQSAGLPLAR